MRLFSLLFILTSIASCSTSEPKDIAKSDIDFSPKTANTEVDTIKDEYFKIGSKNNILFTKNVSIEFSDIKKGSVIGVCSYHKDSREITLDKNFWTHAKWSDKVALVYHEMTHCYCDRMHDFDKEKKYTDNTEKSIFEFIFNPKMQGPIKEEGYFDDFCPVSIMHPIIVDDKCFSNHYQHYAKEMFDRCDPW
jgi:hypothetical protein